MFHLRASLVRPRWRPAVSCAVLAAYVPPESQFGVPCMQANDEPAALAARTLSHLRAYAEQFLEAGYDVLMEVIR